jgi:hypothetical protein
MAERPASVDLMVERADKNPKDMDVQRMALHPMFSEHYTRKEIQRIRARITRSRNRGLRDVDNAGIGGVMRLLDPSYPKPANPIKKRKRDYKKERGRTRKNKKVGVYERARKMEEREGYYDRCV